MFLELMEKIAQALDDRNIPYMVIGGQAVLIYGEFRATADIDITLGVAQGEFPRILEMAGALGMRPMHPDPESQVNAVMVFPVLDLDTGIRVEFIFSFSPYERQAITRTVPRVVRKTPIHFATAEDLVAMKVFSERPRDWEDARSIMLKNPDLDIKYILFWLKQFDDATEMHSVERFQSIRKSL